MPYEQNVYSGHVTDRELAMFSAIVYRSIQQQKDALAPHFISDDPRLGWWRELALGKNWEILDHSEGMHGYRGIAYIHHTRKQVVIAHRGTEQNESVTLWTDWDAVVNSRFEAHQESAYTFVTRLNKNKIIKDYQISFTGHSLGAWLASISAALFNHPAVVFDNPGAKEIIPRYFKGKGEAFDEKSLILTNYLAQPNAINTAHPQTGRSLHIRTSAPRCHHEFADLKTEIKYTLAQHEIELFVEAFDIDTGMPKEVYEIIRWPCGGAEAAQKLVALFPNVAKDFLYGIAQLYYLERWDEGKILHAMLSIIQAATSVVTNSPWAVLRLLPLGLINEIISSLPTIYDVFSEFDYASVHKYLNHTTIETSEEEFDRFFNAHYEIIPFDPYSLSKVYFHWFLFEFLELISLLKKIGKDVSFPSGYDYLNHFEYSSHDEKIKIPFKQMTIIEFRRQLALDLPQVKKILDQRLNDQKFYQQTRPSWSPWNIPSATAEYIPRSAAFRALQEGFNKNLIGSSIQCLFSLGGMGKTQIAINYAQQAVARGDYQIVAWFTATVENFAKDYRQFVTSALGISIDNISIEELHPRVNQHFQQYPNILLIFDNVDSLSEIKFFLDRLPVCKKVDVLLTTRNQNIANYCPAIELEKFTLQEAEEYIIKNINYYQGIAGEASLLASTVDFHPLSLSYVVTYMKNENISIRECCDLYEKKKVILIQEAMENHPNHMHGTSILSLFDKVFLRNPLAKELLIFCSFLSAEKIPNFILNDFFKETASIEEINQARQLLQNYSFIYTDAKQPGFIRTHRLLQEIVLQMIQQDNALFIKYIHLLLSFFNNRLVNFDKKITSSTEEKLRLSIEFTHAWVVCNRLMDFLINSDLEESWLNLLEANFDYQLDWVLDKNTLILILQLVKDIEITNLPQHSGRIRVLMMRGKLTAWQGNYTLALEHYRQALDKYRLFGNQDTHLVNVLNALGDTLLRLKAPLEARKCHEEALRIAEFVYTEQHPIIGRTLIELARACYWLHEYEQAENYAKRALNIAQKSDPNSLFESDCLNHLGNTMISQGNLIKARDYHEQSLEILKVIFGKLHPDIAISLNNLALIFHKQHNYEQAQIHHESALTMQKAIYGFDPHPHIAVSLQSLGDVLYDQKKYSQAQAHHEQALEMLQSLHGANPHHAIASELYALSRAFFGGNDYSKAQSYCEQALVMTRILYKETHPSVVACLKALGRIFYKQGNFKDAQTYYEEALLIQQKMHGHSPLAVILLIDLANCFYEQALNTSKNISLPLKLYEKSARLFFSIPFSFFKKNVDHPQSFEQAKIHYLRALASSEKLEKENNRVSSIIAHALRRVAQILYHQDNVEAASEYYKKALSMYKKTSPDDSSLIQRVELELMRCDSYLNKGIIYSAL